MHVALQCKIMFFCGTQVIPTTHPSQHAATPTSILPCVRTSKNDFANDQMSLNTVGALMMQMCPSISG